MQSLFVVFGGACSMLGFIDNKDMEKHSSVVRFKKYLFQLCWHSLLLWYFNLVSHELVIQAHGL